MSQFPDADLPGLAQSAATLSKTAVDRNREDARLGFKYLLLRLTAAGLNHPEVNELRDLALAIIEKKSVNHVIDKILKGASSSPLAVAIANVVDAAPEPQRLDVLLGSVLSAHASDAAHNGDRGLVVFAAIVGAATAQGSQFTREIAEREGWKQFIQRE